MLDDYGCNYGPNILIHVSEFISSQTIVAGSEFILLLRPTYAPGSATYKCRCNMHIPMKVR